MVKAPVIFVGFEIDEKIDRALAGCRETDRVYLNDPAYLDQALIDGRRYIGKPLGDNAGFDRIEDMARNVASLLGRIGPELHLEVAEVRLAAGEHETDGVPPAGHADDPDL